MIIIQEKIFFGEEASVLQNRHKLKQQIPEYNHLNLDITGNQVKQVFEKYGNNIKLIIHAAAQPSHDWAATNPFLDFNVNAMEHLIFWKIRETIVKMLYSYLHPLTRFMVITQTK